MFAIILQTFDNLLGPGVCDLALPPHSRKSQPRIVGQNEATMINLPSIRRLLWAKLL
jgi:hypothetical protein